MGKINKQNYSNPNKTGFENSPAKVWHVNELAGSTLGYKSISGFINFISAGNTESVTILSNDTDIPNSSVTISKITNRAWLNLSFSTTNVIANHALITNLNLSDEIAAGSTFVNSMSVSVNPSSTPTNIVYDLKLLRNSTGTPVALSIGGDQPKIIYFEFKIFI